MTKTFKVPFATQGDRTSIPNEVQADGAVSYTQGYGYDYERDQVSDPAAKDIEREKMNGIFHDITEAIGEVQNYGFPKWTEEGKPYPIRAIVYHKNKVWQSKVENNEVEPVAGAQWAELKADLTADDINAYNKTESDKRFQPLGNYLVAGYSYSKQESDTNYQPKGNYAPAANYAMKGDSYTKAEGDGRYQPKGNYAPAGDYALNGYAYTKSESDGRYQPKGNYLPAGYSYSKQESDTNYQPKGNYQPAGNYALKGESYLKSESDFRYQPSGNYVSKDSTDEQLLKSAFYAAGEIGAGNPKGNNPSFLLTAIDGHEPQMNTRQSGTAPWMNFKLPLSSGRLSLGDTANKNDIGYLICGDTGIIIQWGYVKGCLSETDYRQFLIPFRERCFQIITTYAGFNDFGMASAAVPVTTKNFLVTSRGSNGSLMSGTVRYIAIGY